jgi:predicted ribosome quality control (RQC) complex YloA/Tae2 family protein
MKIVLDIRKSVEENAEFYFEQAKKARRKSKGAKEITDKFELELGQTLNKEEERKPAVEQPILKEQKERKWYEKYRWFLSSEGFLCVGGRDASSNEVVVKKYTEPHDIVCHTEAPGSPFFVVKTEGNEPGEITKKEILIATASYSRAWKRGLSSTEAFCVAPDQISKEAQAGEYLTKGSFMVRGKRDIQNVELKLAIGILPDGRIMAGPETAIKKHCEKAMQVLQGSDRPSDAAKKIQKYLGGGDLDEIIRSLPAGTIKVVGLE